MVKQACMAESTGCSLSRDIKIVKDMKTSQTPTGMPNDHEISRAAKIIRAGGVVLFPAKCLYGLAADAMNSEAVERVFQIKQRPRTNPLLVLIRDIHDLDGLVKSVPESARVLMDRFWPGDVTIVFHASDKLSTALTAGTGKIGIRMPQHPIAKALVKRAGVPITGTSANISGMEGCSSISMIDSKVLGQVDMVLNAGFLRGGKGSTVVDVTEKPLKILREGQILEYKILKIISGLY